MEEKAMTQKVIKVHYDNGNTITTRINATVSDIINLYIDRPTVFEDDKGREQIAMARCVEFLNAPARKPWAVASYRMQLKRVYSISREYMDRYDLFSKIRVTARLIDDFMPIIETSDFAYITGALEY
jgi:hypothetical protein